MKNVLVNMLQSAFKKALSHSKILVSVQLVSNSEMSFIFDESNDSLLG